MALDFCEAGQFPSSCADAVDSDRTIWSTLTVIVIAEAPSIAAAVIDSLPIESRYFLVGPAEIAFLGRSVNCRRHFANDLSLEESNKVDFAQIIQGLGGDSSQKYLIPADDAAFRIVNATSCRLGCSRYPAPDYELFETLNDKWQFYLLCERLRIPVPKTIRFGLKTEIDFEFACASVGLPFVLKPTNKSNSLGVQLIRSKEELQENVLSCRKYRFAPLIAQSFVPGSDIDISALADKGRILNFAVQVRKKGALSFVQNHTLTKLAQDIVREHGYSGVIHIDAKLHEESNQIFLIEANPRFWASLAAATAAGLNFVSAGVFVSARLENPEPLTISNVSVPSTGRILTEILTLRRNFFRMRRIEHLRMKRGMRSYIRGVLHLR